MYRIKSGSTTHCLDDTVAFIGLLNNLHKYSGGELREFFSPGEIVVGRAPGRIDLMGGIADYSGSLVLQLPIAAAAHVALQLCEDPTIRIASLPGSPGDPLRLFEISLANFQRAGSPIDYAAASAIFSRDPEHHWAAYVAGSFHVLMRERREVFKRGARILVSSAVPEGKGVASSAALEVAAMQTIAAAYELEMCPRQIAFLCQRVENLIAGAPCGVMDQMTAACGEAERLLLLLCQPGELKATIGLPNGLAVWGLDSGIRHSIGGADYGTVRTAAFMGYRIIAEMAGLRCHELDASGSIQIHDDKWNGYLANIAPRDFEQHYAAHLPRQMLGEEFLEKYKGITDSVTAVKPGRSYPVLPAARHPIKEHARVKKFAEVLTGWTDLSQAEVLGELMYESHQSYSTCGLGSAGTDDLVSLVREAGTKEGLYGAKITGGGSGGTVAVLGHREARSAIESIVKRYGERNNYQPVVTSGSSPGAGTFGHLRLAAEM